MVEIDHGFTTDMIYAVAGTFTGGLSSKGYRELTTGWYKVKKVYAICPEKKEVEGDTTYTSLEELPEAVDVMIVVHKKDMTTEMVRKASLMDKKPAIWFMPGTDSQESIDICEANSMNYGKSCIMGHRKFTGFSRFFNMHFIHSKIGKMNRIPEQE